MDLSADIPIFFSADSPGIEQITYVPATGAPRQIYAYVNRGPLDVTQHGGKSVSQDVIEVEVAQHATFGILTPKYKFDKLTIKAHIGGSVDKTYVISEAKEENVISKILICTS
jgi:hypothetical protein